MSGTLTTQMILKFLATGTKAFDLDTADDPLAVDWTQLLSSGTGANQASNMFHDTRTLTAAATEDLDLSGGLSNVFGVSLVFTKIKLLAFKAAAGNTNNVNIQRATANGFVTFLAALDGVALRPGGVLLLTAPDVNGMAVTAGTGDLLTITNSAAGTSVDYSVLIIGVD